MSGLSQRPISGNEVPVDQILSDEAGDDGIVDHPVWSDGDFALISSDSTRFRMDSCHLASAR
jgi:hypothetical protein